MSNQLVSTSSLSAYWRFNGNANDSHTGSNDLTAYNSPTYGNDGKFGQCIQLNNADNHYLNITENSSLDTSTDTPWTIATWVKPGPSFGQLWLCGKTNSNTNLQRCAYGIRMYDGGQTYIATVGNNSSFGEASASATGYGTWDFVVAWHDTSADTINIQVNNGAVSSSAYSAGTYNNSYAFTIGTAGVLTSNDMSGSISGFGLWIGRVLSSDERNYLWNSGSGLDYPFTSSGSPPEPPGPTGPYNIRITSQGSFPVRIHRSGNVPIEIKGTFS